MKDGGGGINQLEMNKFIHDQHKEIIFCPKYVMVNGTCFKEFHLNITYPVNLKIVFCSIDNKAMCVLNVKQNGKDEVKLNLHCQEDGTAIPIFRIDFNSPGHVNPEIITNNVPELMKKYRGALLDNNHIHFYVDGFKGLKWAVPLSDIKEIVVKDFDCTNLYINIANIVLNVFTVLNVQTKITTQTLML